MPELPEVETIRKGLENKILNKKITNLEILKDRLVRNNKAGFQKEIVGNTFRKIDRIGKLLIFELGVDKHLLVHLKMTGQLIYKHNDQVLAGGHSTTKLDIMADKYSYVIFTFIDGSRLSFNDMRQFGYLHLVDHKNKEGIKSKYGLEPLSKEFTYENFKKVLKKRTGILKAVLLNQQIFSGIGNIYADEICYQAKVKPSRKISSLKEAEIKELYKACQYIIKKAVDNRGTTFNNYRDSDNKKGNFVKYLKAYGRAGKKCLRCKKADIKKIKVAGRGTCYCPNCQK